MSNISSSSGDENLGFAARINRRMRSDVAAGAILVVAASLGFAIANSPLASSFFAVRDTVIGPASLGLNLSIGTWTADGLLAIFFFLVGLELKREFVAGDLHNPKAALVPVAAAFGGVIVPALIYAAVNWGTPQVNGWAVPTATDIAFAVAVLGLTAPRIPSSLRIFLLTLAVVDDLIAIGIIAIFFTSSLNWVSLLIAIVPLTLFWVLLRYFGRWFSTSSFGPWLILLPLAAVTWALFHASGIHATVAGVVLAFLVPVRGKHGEHTADAFEHRFTLLSTGLAVPLFAFFAAGVSLQGEHHFPADPIAIGIILGLVLGKPIGIVLTTLTLTKFTPATLAGNPKLRDLIGIGALAGVGFTVSLLVTELSFSDPVEQNTARLAVIAASLVAIAFATALLARKRPREETRVISVLSDDS